MNEQIAKILSNVYPSNAKKLEIVESMVSEISEAGIVIKAKDGNGGMHIFWLEAEYFGIAKSREKDGDYRIA